jgi:hypothetical protein
MGTAATRERTRRESCIVKDLWWLLLRAVEVVRWEVVAVKCAELLG